MPGCLYMTALTWTREFGLAKSRLYMFYSAALSWADNASSHEDGPVGA